MIPEQGRQVSSHVQALNQGQQTQQVTDTRRSAAASARVNPFDDVMTSIQLRKRLSPQETAHVDFHSMAALLDRLHTASLPEAPGTALMLRNQVQEYRKKHRRMQHNDALTLLVTQLDRALFDDTFPPDIRSDIVHISSTSAVIAAFIQQVAERRETIDEGADLARMMIQWAKEVSPDSENRAVQLKEAFYQLEHIWNSQSPADIDARNGIHGRDSILLQHEINAFLINNQAISSQLARLRPVNNDWLLIASQSDNEVRFLSQHMEHLREAGFTTLVLKQLNAREGQAVNHFLRTAEINAVLSDFLQKKNQYGEARLWQELFEKAFRHKIAIVPLHSDFSLMSVNIRPAWAKVWQETLARQLLFEQLSALGTAGKKVILTADLAQLQSGDGFNGRSAGIARRLNSPILAINGNKLNLIADNVLQTLSHFTHLMSPEALEEKAYVLLKSRGNSYHNILALLKKLPDTLGRERVETAFMLKHSLAVYQQKHPDSPRKTSFVTLENQLDRLLFENNVMKLLPSEDKSRIRQIVRTRPLLAAALWQIVGSARFNAAGDRKTAIEQLCYFVQKDSWLQLTGWSEPVNTELPFEPTFHIPVPAEYRRLVRLFIARAQKHGYLRLAKFSADSGILHLGYNWPTIQRLLSGLPKEFPRSLKAITGLFYEVMNAVRLPGQTDEKVMLHHFAAKGYLGRLQRERLMQFEQGVNAEITTIKMAAWDELYPHSALEDFAQRLVRQPSLAHSIEFLLNNYSGLLFSDRRNHAFSIVTKFMPLLQARGITTLCIPWLSKEKQPLIDRFLRARHSIMSGDLKMLLTPVQQNFFIEARSFEMKIVALHSERLPLPDTPDLQEFYLNDAISERVELLNSLAQRGEKFIVLTGKKDLLSYRLSHDNFLPGLAFRMQYPILDLHHNGKITLIHDNPLTITDSNAYPVD